MVGNKRRHMGLGGFPEVPLAKAKEKARAAKEQIDQGIDPIVQRLAIASSLKAQQATQKTFKQAALAYIEAHGEGWKNPKHRAQWGATLETYAYPHLGDLLVQDVGQDHVLKVLEPIWKTKTETATRLRGRIESVLDWPPFANIGLATTQHAGRATSTSYCPLQERSRRLNTIAHFQSPRWLSS